MKNSIRLTGFVCFLFLSLFVPSAAMSAGKSKSPLQIHIISANREYKSEPSLKELKKYLETNYRVKCTASWGHDGIRELENLEELKSADLMLIFARRMRLNEEQMKIIRNHWQQGKPIVGIRTASHAFQREDNKIFDLEVLGNNYKGHYGQEKVKVINVKPKHPVLAGVKPFTSRRLYKTGPLPKETTVLQIGEINRGKHPVTMVNIYNNGRVFYTSLGVPEDFQDENFRRMIVNAIFWTTHRNAASMKK